MIASNALYLLRRHAVVSTLRRHLDTAYDPQTGRVERQAQLQRVRCVFVEAIWRRPASQYPSGQALQRVLIASEGVDNIPRAQDVLDYEDEQYSIASVRTIMSDSQPIAYMCEVMYHV